MPKWNFSFISVTIHPSRWPLRHSPYPVALPPSSFIYIYIYLTTRFFLSFRLGRNATARLCARRNVNHGHAVKDVRESPPPPSPRIRRKSRNLVNGKLSITISERYRLVCMKGKVLDRGKGKKRKNERRNRGQHCFSLGGGGGGDICAAEEREIKGKMTNSRGADNWYK